MPSARNTMGQATSPASYESLYSGLLSAGALQDLLSWRLANRTRPRALPRTCQQYGASCSARRSTACARAAASQRSASQRSASRLQTVLHFTHCVVKSTNAGTTRSRSKATHCQPRCKYALLRPALPLGVAWGSQTTRIYFKRQKLLKTLKNRVRRKCPFRSQCRELHTLFKFPPASHHGGPVSYTHLTLPTICSV